MTILLRDLQPGQVGHLHHYDLGDIPPHVRDPQRMVTKVWGRLKNDLHTSPHHQVDLRLGDPIMCVEYGRVYLATTMMAPRWVYRGSLDRYRITWGGGGQPFASRPFDPMDHVYVLPTLTLITEESFPWADVPEDGQ